MAYRVLRAADAHWRPSNQMGVLNTDLARQLGAETLGVRLWRLAPGQASTRHRHRGQAELYVLLEGTGRMRVDGDALTLEPLSAVLVEPETVRQPFNDTGADQLWLVVGAPPEPANTREMTPDEVAFLTSTDLGRSRLNWRGRADTSEGSLPGSPQGRPGSPYGSSYHTSQRRKRWPARPAPEALAVRVGCRGRPPVSPREAETLPRGGADALLKERYRERLAEARERTRALVGALAVADVERVHDPLMSPLAWDLGHIAAYEDLWLGRRTGRLPPLRPELDEVYDATETPRASRREAGWLGLAEALKFMDAVRERSLTALAAADLSPHAEPLTAEGFVLDLVIEHEHQHNETMLQTLALADPGVVRPSRRALPGPGQAAGPGAYRVAGTTDMARVEEGPFLMGAGSGGFAYDNERPRHELELPAFELDRTPVTNGAYLEFVALGGYHTRRLWSPEGWAWKEAAGVEQPLYWTDDLRVRSFDRTEAIDPHLPVLHVSFHEAEAYARFRGKRLPSEAEWEKAASWDQSSGRQRRFPWGEEPPSEEVANLDGTAFGPAPAGAFPAGASPCGALGLVGDAWEWTASDFSPYPGFRAFPYPEYSEVFFGDGYKVLRGGSWATRPGAIRTTFRNWDLPQRRQIFAGFRCAADA